MKGRRKILTIITVLILAAISYGLYVWNKPQRDAADEKAIVVTAVAIFDDYTKDETNANKLYLDKAIQVNGEITEYKKNHDGEAVVYLKTNDPVFGVNCTFKEDPGTLENGSIITFNGICKGFTGDVVIKQGFLIKP